MDTNLRVQESQVLFQQDEKRREKDNYLSDLRSQLSIKGTNETPLIETVTRVKRVLQQVSEEPCGRQRCYPQQMSSKLLQEEETFSSWLSHN
jgi:hypothetical protein